MVINTAGFQASAAFSSFRLGLYALVVHLTYSAIYLLPAAVVVLVVFSVLIGRQQGAEAVPKWRRVAVLGGAVLLAAATQIFIYVDKLVFGLFGYHLNGFAWNLVTTPGGIESMGGGSGMRLAALVLAIVFLAAEAAVALVVTLGKPGTVLRSAITRRALVVLLVLLVVASSAERLTYAWSALKARSSVLTVGPSFPFYKTTSMKKLAKKMGVEIVKRRSDEIDVANSRIQYPLKPLVVNPPAKKYNILWLTVESLRADVLTPEIMPKTWEFAQKAHRFDRHYSGGNGTRMGVFALFYGLYGSYWFPFLAEHRHPVLFDVLEKQNYQFSLYTSARFTYPEFDKTIFASIPPELMHEGKGDVGWEKDRENVGHIIDFIANRDKARPFMVYLFFESPHADYDFPDESIIRTPYLDKMNYATMDPKRDMPLIFNRYINSVRHLDSQVARLVEDLEQEKLMDDTIIILSGDHGEEFMEKGRWGHNSAFTEEQIRTPLVLWIPGKGSGVSDKMTSHLDIVPTIMPLLGVQNPIGDFSQGFDLLGPEERSFTVVADWSNICYIDRSHKATFRYRAGGDQMKTSSMFDDKEVSDEAAFKKTYDEAVLVLGLGLSRFMVAPGR